MTQNYYEAQFSRWAKRAERVPYSPVHHWASVLFPFGSENKQMLILTAYFDETGDDADPQGNLISGIGGLMTTVEFWTDFEVQWDSMLKNYSLEFAHMNEFAHSVGQYKGWGKDQQKRQRYLQDVWDIIEASSPIIFGCFVPLNDYKSLLSTEQRKALVNSYLLTFQTVQSQVIAAYCDAALTGMPIGRIVTMFDDKKGIQGLAKKFYDFVLSDEDNHIRRHVAAPVFENMRDFRPLQAADCIAYESAKEFNRRLYASQFEPRYGIKRLQKIIQKAADHYNTTLPLGEPGSSVIFRPLSFLDGIASTLLVEGIVENEKET